MQLNKSIERWVRCDPRSMAKMSEMAIMYAFEDARTDILSLHREIERLNAVREGWVIVPVEPTQAMLDANGTSNVPAGTQWLNEDARNTWASMLAAAPNPPLIWPTHYAWKAKQGLK